MNRNCVFGPLGRAISAGLLTTVFAVAGAWAQAATTTVPPKGAIRSLSAAELHSYLKAKGYAARGGIGHDVSDSSDSRYRGLVHFTQSFTFGGVQYPYTMLGHPPRSGKSASLRTVIVPLRMHFVGFGPAGNVNVDFDPMPAVNNIVASPMFQNAGFANGVGQFVDMMQRATFWNKMDADHEWHLRMAQPVVRAPVDVEVTPETGTLSQSGTAYFGDVLIDFMDAEARTIIQVAGLDPDEMVMFVTDNVTAQALGYHSAYTVANPDGSVTLQTMIYTSWLDPALVDPIIADVSTINHEMGEWANDPFTNNVVPGWAFPPASDPNSGCSGSNLLEVGDPEGNGATYVDFPTVVVPVGGYPYHLQDLVMLPWFAGEVPSSAQNGWYDFPATNYITSPTVVCP